jgi:ATP-binding protein involved in chromosome partitioning
MTGRPLLDPATVPHDVSPVTIRLVGNYAIRIDWSDGHTTGIYTYELLAAVCPCDACRRKRKGGDVAE